MLSITVEAGDDYTLCRPEGELDAYTVGTFRETLAELTDTRHLLIDLSDVPFMDSAGLGALIGGIRRTREAGGDVAVACGRPTLTRLLHTTGFDRIVAVTETVAEAATALADATRPVRPGLTPGDRPTDNRPNHGGVGSGALLRRFVTPGVTDRRDWWESGGCCSAWRPRGRTVAERMERRVGPADEPPPVVATVRPARRPAWTEIPQSPTT